MLVVPIYVSKCFCVSVCTYVCVPARFCISELLACMHLSVSMYMSVHCCLYLWTSICTHLSVSAQTSSYWCMSDQLCQYLSRWATPFCWRPHLSVGIHTSITAQHVCSFQGLCAPLCVRRICQSAHVHVPMSVSVAVLICWCISGYTCLPVRVLVLLQDVGTAESR